MNTITPNNGLLDKLSVPALISYLERTGWVRVDHPNKRIILFEGPPDDEGQPLQLVLPSDQSFDDAKVRLAESVGLLSTLLQVSPEAVVQRITDTELATSKHESMTTTVKDSLDNVDQPTPSSGVLVEQPSWVMPTSIEKHLRWKRRRETWPPFVNAGIAFLALVAVSAQVGIYYKLRQIMNSQSEFMNEQIKLMQRSFDISEESLQISQRAYVGVASITTDLQGREIAIMLQNIGHVPAKGVKLYVQETRTIPGENGSVTGSGEIINPKQLGSDFHWEAGEVQLFPGTPMSVVMHLKSFQSEEVAAILSKKEILYIGGTIQYEDGFGNCKYTTFAFRYDPLNKAWFADPRLSKFFNRNGC